MSSQKKQELTAGDVGASTPPIEHDSIKHICINTSAAPPLAKVRCYEWTHRLCNTGESLNQYGSFQVFKQKLYREFENGIKRQKETVIEYLGIAFKQRYLFFEHWLRRSSGIVGTYWQVIRPAIQSDNSPPDGFPLILSRFAGPRFRLLYYSGYHKVTPDVRFLANHVRIGTHQPLQR